MNRVQQALYERAQQRLNEMLNSDWQRSVVVQFVEEDPESGYTVAVDWGFLGGGHGIIGTFYHVCTEACEVCAEAAEEWVDEEIAGALAWWLEERGLWPISARLGP